ncbi:MAG: polysaccharide deacetylase family protein [Paracoccaceae bacterium]|nr:polysaccharide deacetylase family protein [Paracoccaceae bacterium]
MTDQRDFKEYFRAAPAPNWPNGARLAVSCVPKVENGAVLSIADDTLRNESNYEIREEVFDHPDPYMETHFTHGTHQGYGRIAKAFDRFGGTATFSTCGHAAEGSPWLLQDAVARGHVMSCHRGRWERQAEMPIAEEQAMIAKTHTAIARTFGVTPVGWHTRSVPSMNTRDLLCAHGGFDYDSDVYDDDTPRIHNRQHAILPDAFDTNDMQFSPGGGFVQSYDFSDYGIGAFERLYAEGSETARMMFTGLHLRLIGRPVQIAGLESVREHISAKPKIWSAQIRQIPAYWRAASS